MENDKNIDQATSEWLKKLSLDEPSDSFLRNVMHSVYALEKKKSNDINYWWFLLLIPVLLAGCWYLSTLPAFVERLTEIWSGIQNYYYSLNADFGDIFTRLKKITISPVVILIFLAVLSLLIVEDIFSKSRHKLNAE